MDSKITNREIITRQGMAIFKAKEVEVALKAFKSSNLGIQ
jgi:hypothetical protein